MIFVIILTLLAVSVGLFALLLVARKQAASNQHTINPQQLKYKQDNLQKILEYLNSKDKVTNNEVERLLKVSDATAERYLNELKKEGLIEQVGESGRGVYYRSK